MPVRLDDKVAVITGGGAGIGLEVARRFAEEGAAIAIFDLDPEAAEAAAAGIVDTGGTAIALTGDVTSEEDVAGAMTATVDQLGRLDMLVNSAGAVFNGSCDETSLDLWNTAIGINLTGTFLCCKHAIPKMLDIGGGSIVNISALAGLVGVGRRAAYASAKAGVLGLTRSITYDYARSGIRCNAICPATTRTTMVENIAQTYDDPEAFLTHVSERQYVGRMAEPSEIASAVLFLASSEGSYLFGAYLPVDGGVTSTSPRS
jgi:NAD(P)-dependent dehydrogenase (short-subunit alcohol dehydrogenase family)